MPSTIVNGDPISRVFFLSLRRTRSDGSETWTSALGSFVAYDPYALQAAVQRQEKDLVFNGKQIDEAFFLYSEGD